MRAERFETDMNASMRTLHCAIAGASGRMGQALIDQVADSADMRMVGAWVGPASSYRGMPVRAPDATLSYGVVGETTHPPDIVIDFSHADAFDDVLAWCGSQKVPLVSGTTGLNDVRHGALAEAANAIPVLWSANFSLGMAVLTRAVTEAARMLPDWDADIVEAHHAGKRDAPSGTALALGRAVAQSRNQRFDTVSVLGRQGADRPRQPGEIGFAAVRAGDIVGEHTVMLATRGERLELTHRAGDRRIFVHGALHAARWLAGRRPGLYVMQDCLSDASA